MVSQNESFNIVCQADGNPTPTITWILRGVSISVGETLTVARAQLKDIGTYHCVANNGIGAQSNSSAIVEVKG